MTPSSDENERLRWNEVQKEATAAWFADDLPDALRQLGQFLAGAVARPLRREALAFRAMLYEEFLDPASAEADFRAALELADEGYARSELEESLGVLKQREGDLEAADRWFKSALHTTAGDPRAAGGGLLLKLFELRRPQDLTSGERELVAKVIRQTWALLRIEGEPDLHDPEGTARMLVEAQQGPFSPERPPRAGTD